MSGPKHTPYPEWVEEAVRDHYDRIAEGVEDKPHVGIADMLWDAYERGQRDAAPRLADELAAWRAWAERWGRDIEQSASVSPITHDELVERLEATSAALREAGVGDA